jgi:hypothetical protein
MLSALIAKLSPTSQTLANSSPTQCTNPKSINTRTMLHKWKKFKKEKTNFQNPLTNPKCESPSCKDWIRCKQDKMNNLITLSNLEQIDLK